MGVIASVKAALDRIRDMFIANLHLSFQERLVVAERRYGRGPSAYITTIFTSQPGLLVRLPLLPVILADKPSDDHWRRYRAHFEPLQVVIDLL